MLPIDLRDAIRRWRRRPGLALAATLVLALGIGATTAMYSIVDAVLLRQEPWPAGDSLVRIYGVEPPLRTNPAYRTTWNKAGINLTAWRSLQQTSAFSEVGVWIPTEQVLGNERTELVRGIYASSNLLPLFGVQPALGRLFIEDDDASDTALRDKGALDVLSRLFGLFGAGALLLTAIGLYSVTAFSVAQRRRELGIRIALGATRLDLLRLVGGQGIRQVAIGLAAGTVLAFVLTRAFTAAIEFLPGQDAAVLPGVLLSLFVTSVVALVGPIHRASAVDPVQALRGN